MRDIPVFSTENGVASLGLKEIPYSAEAYITVQDTQAPAEFLEECAAFCRSCGAERIYAKEHGFLERYPLHTAVWRMMRPIEGLPETDAALMPVTQQTIEQWRALYNSRMAGVPNAAHISFFDGKKLLAHGEGYFVHRGGTLLGIGIAGGTRIDAVIAAQRGCGREVLLALSHALSGDEIVLEVASENTRALRLYASLGFIRTAELSRWYRIE